MQAHGPYLMIPIIPLISIAAGVLILIFPRLLNYIVAFYLIIGGVLGVLYRF